jgi:hypothetical protein
VEEVSMLALHLLQSALVFVNTLLLQQNLAEDDWAKLLTTADKRALTPLFWSHANLYGRTVRPNRPRHGRPPRPRTRRLTRRRRRRFVSGRSAGATGR